MNVVVVGAGAVGSLFGARLARAGHSVTLVGRADHVAAVVRSGLRVVDHGEEVVRVDAVTALAAGARCETALLTVKTFDLARVASGLARAVPRPVPTLLTQNGLGVEPLASRALGEAGWARPEEWTVRAVHSVPATLVGPGVVRAAGTGEILLPGSDAASPHAAAFAELLGSAGFAVRRVPEFDREVWRKVLVNAAINPLTAVRGVENGRLLEEPLRGEAVALLREALLAARAEGYDFGEEEAVAAFEQVARATAANRSSMLQDLDRGRPTEVDAISGALVAVAAAHAIDLPRTRAIAAEVRARARAGAGRAQPS